MKFKLHTLAGDESFHLGKLVGVIQLLGGVIVRLDYVPPLRCYFVEVQGCHFVDLNTLVKNGLDVELI